MHKSRHLIALTLNIYGPWSLLHVTFLMGRKFGMASNFGTFVVTYCKQTKEGFTYSSKAWGLRVW